MKPTLEIYWTRGLPASGKSTWAREWVEENPKNRVRVNRDDIRLMLGPYWIPQREDLVTQIENSMIREAIDEGYSVVIDATNFRGIGRFENIENKDGISLRNLDHVTFLQKDFTHVPLEECIRRDKERTEGHVGEEPIIRMYNKYLKQ